MLAVVGISIIAIILVFAIYKLIQIFQRKRKQPEIKPPEKPPLTKTESRIYCPRCHYIMYIPFQKPDDIYGNVKSHLCPICHTFMRIS
jgi:uncharacterized paraquat-inducible protein A